MINTSVEPEAVPRREWLVLAGGSLSAAIAGCLGGDDDDNDDADTDDGEGDSNGDTDDEPAPQSEVTVLGLTVGGQSVAGGDEDSTDDSESDTGGTGDGSNTTPQIVVDSNVPIRATVANEGDAEGSFQVEFQVSPQDGDTDEPAVTKFQRVSLAPGDQQRVTIDGVTGQLDGQDYDLVVRAGEATLTGSLTVAVTTEVEVLAYTEEVRIDKRAEEGLLTLYDYALDGADRTQLTTAQLNGEPVTLQVPLDTNTPEFAIEVTDVEGGAFPSATKVVTIDSLDIDTIEIVAGYEFRAADTYRFSTYSRLSADLANHDQPQQWWTYGSYAGGFDYYYVQAKDTVYLESAWAMGLNGSPPEYGIDMDLIQERHGSTSGLYGVSIGQDGYLYLNVSRQDYWVSDNNVALRTWIPHTLARGGDKGGYLAKMGRQFVGREQFRGNTVDVYELYHRDDFPSESPPNRKVYVDSETGYTVRLEEYYSEEAPIEYYTISEYTAHDEIESIDFELLRKYTTSQTGEGLEELPWG
jgi:hypothetical protein